MSQNWLRKCQPKLGAYSSIAKQRCLRMPTSVINQNYRLPYFHPNNYSRIKTSEIHCNKTSLFLSVYGLNSQNPLCSQQNLHQIRSIYHVKRARGNPYRYSHDGDGKMMLRFLISSCLFTFGAVWCCVPAYRMYCQQSGTGQADAKGHRDYEFMEDSRGEEYLNSLSEKDRAEHLRQQKLINDSLIKISFSATVHESLKWEFVPQQRHMYVACGETALAFYRAKKQCK